MSNGLALGRWRRVTTLAAEQALVSASAYSVSWMFIHLAPAHRVPGFYICWLWGWGLFTVLSELLLTQARVLRADRVLPDGVLSAVVLSACTGSALALCISGLASLLAAGTIAFVAVAVGLGLAALAFFARRLQADEEPFGVLPRACGYLVLAAAGCCVLAAAGLFTEVTANACACVALMVAAVWSNPGGLIRSARLTARLLRQVWPQGRWYAVGAMMRMVLHSAGLITLIRVHRGPQETSVVVAMSVLVGPLSVVGSVLPWAHLPELRSALGGRTAFLRVWGRQLLVYLGILGIAAAGLTVGWASWVHLSVADADLAAAVTSQRPMVLIMLVAVVLNSWTGAALIALEKVKSPLVTLTVSGALAMATVPLGAPATVSVVLPYVLALALAAAVVLAAVRTQEKRTR